MFKLNFIFQLQTFYEENAENSEMDPALLITVAGAITTVDETLGWHESHRDTVVNYLTENAPVSGSAIGIAASPALLLLAAVTAWCNVY